ncbi:YciI family protein, partial [Burkholderia multivorans]
MPFLIETFDKPDHAHVRARERDAHLAFLARHRALLLACGAKLDDDGAAASGGIYIVDVDNREAAERFIAADPFALAGLFERVAIVRWRKAYVD